LYFAIEKDFAIHQAFYLFFQPWINSLKQHFALLALVCRPQLTALLRCEKLPLIAFFNIHFFASRNPEGHYKGPWRFQYIYDLHPTVN